MIKLWYVAALCISMATLGCFQEVALDGSSAAESQGVHVSEVTTPGGAQRLIHSAPTLNDGTQYNPVALIRVVNELIRRGRREAIRILAGYLVACESNDAERLDDPSGALRVLTICRVLFVPRDDASTARRIYLGAPFYGELPAVFLQWPEYPFLLYDDIPVLVESDFILAGGASDAREYLSYCDLYCTIREKPLTPGRPPCKAIEAVIATLTSSADLDPVTLLQANRLLKWQALNALRQVPGWSLDKDPLDRDNWRHYMQVEERRGLQWSLEGGVYVATR